MNKYPNIDVYHYILTNKLLADNLVWKYLDTDISCKCPNCINIKINILESALTSVPPDNQIVNILAVHIQDNMLPELREYLTHNNNIFRNIFNILGIDIESDDQLNELLNRTFNERDGEREKSSDELIKKVRNVIKIYNKDEHKHSKCCLCLEDISNSDPPKLIISCPSCEQVFCAEEKNECLGFFKHMGEDHRCPTCRTKIVDWFKIK